MGPSDTFEHGYVFWISPHIVQESVLRNISDHNETLVYETPGEIRVRFPSTSLWTP